MPAEGKDHDTMRTKRNKGEKRKEKVFNIFAVFPNVSII